jgi:hypothetical protein
MKQRGVQRQERLHIAVRNQGTGHRQLRPEPGDPTLTGIPHLFFGRRVTRWGGLRNPTVQLKRAVTLGAKLRNPLDNALKT